MSDLGEILLCGRLCEVLRFAVFIVRACRLLGSSSFGNPLKLILFFRLVNNDRLFGHLCYATEDKLSFGDTLDFVFVEEHQLLSKFVSNKSQREIEPNVCL